MLATPLAPSHAETLRVVDGEGHPVEAAEVEVWTLPAGVGVLTRLRPPLIAGTTDEKGTLPGSLPAVDDLLVRVDHPSFAPFLGNLPPAGRAVTLSPGATVVVKADLGAPVGRTEGRLCAVWRDEVETWAVQRSWRRCADLAVRPLTLRGLPVSEVVVELEVPGFLPARSRVTPPAEVELILERGTLVEGRILCSSGSGVSAARVSAEPGGESTSDDSGAFRVVASGFPVRLAVQADGYHGTSVRLSAKDALESPTLRLDPAAGVRFTAIDPEGASLEEIVLRAERSVGDRRTTQTRRLERAEAVTAYLPSPGDYRLTLESPGFRPLALPFISVGPGETRDLGLLTLSRGAGVDGRLRDSRDGEPVAGAEVELLAQGVRQLTDMASGKSFRTVSDEAGRFSLAGLDGGRFVVRVRRTGVALGSWSITLEQDRVDDVGDLWLDAGVAVSGRVVDRSGRARGGSIVEFFDAAMESSVPVAGVTTGSRGEFGDLRLAAGDYRVQVHGDRLLLSQEVALRSGETERLLELEVGGVELTGRVVRSGIGVEGGRVLLSDLLDPNHRRGKITYSVEGTAGVAGYGIPQRGWAAEVGPDGDFSIPEAPAGHIRLTYVSPVGEVIERELIVPDQATAHRVVDIGGAVLVGRVVDAEGGERGVRAGVQLFDPAGLPVGRGESDESGYFRLEDLASGSYRLDVRAEGFVAASLSDLEVAGNGPPVVVPLRRGADGVLEVRLRRADGSAVSSAPLALLAASGALYAALPTDALGERTFRELAPGTYFLVWADPATGTGASTPIEIEGGETRRWDRVLPEGQPVAVSCLSPACPGAAIGHLALYTESGVDIAPHLSGMTAASRFSADGTITLGQLAQGAYLLRLGVTGEQWSKRLVVPSGDASVEVP